MKILHIISSGGMYGAEAVILNMSRMLAEGGHESVLGVFANSSNPNLQLHEAAAKEGVESHLIPCSGQIDFSVAAKIRKLASETQADVVHAHGYKADIYIYFALRGASVPIISTCHTWYDNDLMVTLYGVIDRWVLRSFDGVVGVSDEVVQRLKTAGVRQDRIFEIPNGIDLRPFDAAQPSLPKRVAGNGLLVGLIGRLSREKGVDVFIQAAALVLREVPETRFVVVGDGPDRAALEGLTTELGINKSVEFLGRRDDMPGVYASLDVMVSASRQEGSPMALLEGMASSVPLIATPVGEVPALVENNVTGALVPVEDGEALATELIVMLRDSNRRERLAAAGLERIERDFSAARMTADYLAVYEKTVEMRGSGTAATSRGPR
jgi:glycosyltransferase involved in cell wall biosynthesis